MKRFLLFLFCFTGLYACAQDLTGIWRGNFYSGPRTQNTLSQGEQYKFEVQLGQDQKAFEGVTYSYQTTIFYGKATCKGTINPLTKKVLLEELKLVEVRMSPFSDACIMTCFLQYSKIGEEEFLEGTYTSMNLKDSSNCGRGTIYLRKVTTSDFYEEPFLTKRKNNKTEAPKKDTALIAKKPPVKITPAPQKPAPAKQAPIAKANPSTKKTVTPPQQKATTPKSTTPAPVIKPSTGLPLAPTDTAKKEITPTAPIIPVPKVLLSRDNELVKTITTGASEVTINIYDNGSIDHDTVSVYLDKKLVLSRKMLTYKPLTLTLKLDETNNYHELVMVAENLGDIPPNTSLMVVKAGNKEYEVRITSTEQKNAVVIFKYEKE
ncbi:MAG: hypothetical protein QM731_07490 [Chitinophagaceae bacterium]